MGNSQEQMLYKACRQFPQAATSVIKTRAPGRRVPSVTDWHVLLVPDIVQAAAASAALSAPSLSKFSFSTTPFPEICTHTLSCKSFNTLRVIFTLRPQTSQHFSGILPVKKRREGFHTVLKIKISAFFTLKPLNKIQCPTFLEK
ncbi:hypothetical protein XENOCAPTIV_002743 [Xenoophorus captivus]|uniref:Uncharacterized protein n=1 Tax=Xenoophorus captivus TaxID=1517983 RepID=A0ABV0SA30_9TELE